MAHIQLLVCANCAKAAAVRLYTRSNEQVGDFCTKCGNAALLREQAYEDTHGPNGEAL